MSTECIEHTAASDRLRALCVAGAIKVSLAGFIRENDLARLLGVCARTVRTWRHDGSGPRATRIGGAYWYSLLAITEYLGQEVEEGGRTNVAAVAEPVEDGADNYPPIRNAK